MVVVENIVDVTVVVKNIAVVMIVVKKIVVAYFLNSCNFGSRIVDFDDTPIVSDKLDRGVTFAFQTGYTVATNLSFGNLGFAPQLHESAGGLLSLKLSLHSCSLPGSTNAMGIETSIALVLPAREHECDTSFVLGRPLALS
ncbi:hypothetical protein Tco_1041039 [Tanacetum coccineum]|uniref:Uncharacterized protein n=1 Tax=Tanacetum coccineum TaxID=301880 RepID=A0ABQ5GGS3_9ASTR